MSRRPGAYMRRSVLRTALSCTYNNSSAPADDLQGDLSAGDAAVHGLALEVLVCLSLRHALLLDEKGLRPADVPLILELPLQLRIFLEQALNLTAHRAEHLDR